LIFAWPFIMQHWMELTRGDLLCHSTSK